LRLSSSAATSPSHALCGECVALLCDEIEFGAADRDKTLDRVSAGAQRRWAGVDR
jgi:hypothetical protein